MADEKATSALERLSAQAAWAADRKRRMAFWNALLRLRKEFDKERQLDNTNTIFYCLSFENWVQEKYGIKLIFIEGNIGGSYEIVDKHKHLIFLLKYQ